MDTETTHISLEQQNHKSFPLLLGVAAIVIVAGALLFMTRSTDTRKVTRSPDVSGLLDRWQVDESKAYAVIIPGAERSIKQAMTLDKETKYLYRKGKRGDADRQDEVGALANISEGAYIGIYFKQGTQVADTIVYADWPL